MLMGTSITTPETEAVMSGLDIDRMLAQRSLVETHITTIANTVTDSLITTFRLSDLVLKH